MNNLLLDNGYISNCCSGRVHLDTERCLECSEPCQAICEFCENPEDEHKCTECECELTEKECNEQQGMCDTCLRLIQE